MLSRVVLVTGCNRGLGLEFLRQLASQGETGPTLILGTCRDTKDPGPDLGGLLETHPQKIRLHQLDLAHLSAIPEFAASVAGDIAEGGGLSCLINNAGLSPKAARYNRVTHQQMTECFAVHATSPLLLARDLLSAFAEPALVVNMSSSLGSIGNNWEGKGSGTPGGLYPYRASKAALNMITRSMAHDFSHKSVSAIAMHPGWVKTRLGGNHAPMEPHQSIEAMLKFIQQNFDPKVHNGQFLDFNGNTMPF